MRHRSPVLAAAIAAGLLSVSLSGGVPPTSTAKVAQVAPSKDSPMPKVLRTGSASDAVPTWVEGSQALRPSGELNVDLFDPETARTLQRLLTRPETSGCIVMGPPVRGSVQIEDDSGRSLVSERRTLEEAFRASELVLEGKVTGIAFGFGDGTPGQLLRLSPIKIFKDKSAEQRQYFVFLPIGRVQVGEKTICKRDPAYPAAPKVGDRVVVLLQKGFRADYQYLAVPDSTGIVVLGQTNSVGLPAAFRSASARHALSVEDVLSRLEALAKGQEDGR